MDELVDILDFSGNATGKTTLKSDAHKNGWFHPTVHVWFFTSNASILIQQRAKSKIMYPLLWDVSVAGHIGAGENIEDAAVREVLEEIGIAISANDLQKIGIFKSDQVHAENLIDREFQHTYLCELRVELDDLTKQQGEVADLKLIPLLLFSEETWGLANLSKYVPHGVEYYKTIIKAIKKRIV